MDIQIPWSSWFTKKTRRKPDDWMIVEISLEEEFAAVSYTHLTLPTSDLV